MQETNPTSPTEDQNPATKSGVAPNLAPQTDAEKKYAECFKAFQERDKGFVEAAAKRHDTGMKFGQAAIELREEIKSSGDRNFTKRLEQLGSYEKARYWMAKIEGKETDRHKAQEEPTFDWEVAVMQLKALNDRVQMLKKSMPVGRGALGGLLTSLVDLLDYQIVSTGGENEYLLQRVRPVCGSVAEGTDGGRVDSSGSGR
jgi:hypothetical protein